MSMLQMAAVNLHFSMINCLKGHFQQFGTTANGAHGSLRPAPPAADEVGDSNNHRVSAQTVGTWEKTAYVSVVHTEASTWLQWAEAYIFFMLSFCFALLSVTIMSFVSLTVLGLVSLGCAHSFGKLKTSLFSSCHCIHRRSPLLSILLLLLNY